MLRFECDTCQTLKERGQEWILGLAAENIGAVSARREIVFEPEWDERRACHPLAVHFCCVECKDDYLKAMFGENVAAERTTVVPIPASTRSARAAKRTKKRAS